MKTLFMVKRTPASDPVSVRSGGGPAIVNGRPFISTAQRDAVLDGQEWFIVEAEDVHAARRVLHWFTSALGDYTGSRPVLPFVCPHGSVIAHGKGNPE